MINGRVRFKLSRPVIASVAKQSRVTSYKLRVTFSAQSGYFPL